MKPMSDDPKFREIVRKSVKASNKKQAELVESMNIEEHGLAATADWQDRVKFILDSWVKRMIALGELKEPEKIGGFTIYECPDIIPFIEKALDQQRQEILEGVCQ